MRNCKKEVSFNPPARSLDLEYQPDSQLDTTVSQGTSRLVVGLDITLQAWDCLVESVCSVFSVTQNSLLTCCVRTSASSAKRAGGRPNAQLHYARACLVQGLCELMGRETGVRLLRLSGWPLRRIRSLQDVQISENWGAALEHVLAVFYSHMNKRGLLVRSGTVRLAR